jgi:signal transduction histidine kinase
MSRRPLGLPITLAILLLVLVVLLIVGWVVIGRIDQSGAFYWTLLIVGVLFLVLVAVGVVLYLTLSIKAINLTRRQSNFIDSVTHELKSPIASLKLYLQTLKRRPVSQEETADFYQSMLEDVERLDLLINHVLSAAMLDKGTGPQEVERINLGQLLEKCVSEVRLRHQVPTDVITLDLQPCMVRGSHVDLALIFRNLVDNAVKYADSDDPHVGIASQYDPLRGTAIVLISDNGPGIPGPLRRKVFGRFVRLGTELERKKPGTGLGLYIVRTLVNRWKGRVRISSHDGDRGTEFQVTLPNASAPDHTLEADGSDGHHAMNSTDPRKAASVVTDSTHQHGS